jgi:hypothetical protein
MVLPVHNEEGLLPAALASLDRAIGRATGRRRAPGVAVLGVAVVLDACTDDSGGLVDAWRRRAHHRGRVDIEVIDTDLRGVGQARGVGCQALLRRWSDTPAEHIWLATTDADSEVPGDWICAQLRARRLGGQLWVGGVSVDDWTDRAEGTAEAWQRHDEAELLPVHGANFGIDAATYLAAGGFRGLSTGEDRDLFERAVALGAEIGHDPRVRVATSSRREARAPRGFAHALTALEARLAPRAGRTELAVS